jgi:hypothetical protein
VEVLGGGVSALPSERADRNSCRVSVRLEEPKGSPKESGGELLR